METSELAGGSRVDISGRLAPLLDGRFLVALVLLIVNDQLLKAAYGNWLTGKLSDVAGLVVLPVLVAVALDAFGLRRSAALGCGIVGAWFAVMKTITPVAAWTELVFEFITRRPSTIVVDPTDLLGLSGLVIAVAILRRPRPLFTSRQVGYLSLVVAAFACTATSGPEINQADLGVDPATGEVVQNPVGRFEPDGDAPEVDPATPGFGRYETEACLDEADGGDCFRLVDGRIERRTASGEWDLEWVAFDIPLVENHVHGGWGPSIQAVDIVTAPDGTVHVGFFDDFGPIVRGQNGQWTPAASDFRPLGWLVIVYLGLAAAAVAMATGLRYAGPVTYAMAVLGTTGIVISWVQGFLGFDELAGLALIALSILSALLALVIALRRKRPFNMTRLVVAATGFSLGLAVALAWKYVLVAPSWLYVLPLITGLGAVTAGFFFPHPPPPPPAMADGQ